MARLSSTQVFGNLSVTGNTKISGELMVEGAVVGIDKTDVGLSNVDNTADSNKPISTATQTALDGKADSVHTHTIANVTGLQSALDDKLTTTGTAATATKLATARTIGGVSFDGTANINLPGVNTAGNQNTTGSAATLTTARTINGTPFDGSDNITTANWGTARNITIGNATKSIDGSVSVAFTLAEIGAYAGTPNITSLGFGNIGPTVTDASLSIAAGTKAVSNGMWSTSVGSNSEAGSYSTSLGFNANSKRGGTAIGYYAKSTHDYGSIAITCGESKTLASEASGKFAVAIGGGTLASGSESVAIGAVDTIYVGQRTMATGVQSVAIGKGSKAEFDYSTALGRASVTSKTKQVSIATLNSNTHLATNPTLLSGVATPVVAQDAANKAYVDSLNFIRIQATNTDANLEANSGSLVSGVSTLTMSDKTIGFRLDIVGPCVVNIPAGHTLKSVDGKNTVVDGGGATLIKLTSTQWWLAGNLE